MEFKIDQNLQGTKEFLVEQHHIADFLGTGDLAVLSTPSMIMFMEHTCRVTADEQLNAPYTTVGTKVNISHLAAAPKGAKILVKVKLEKQDKRQLAFQVEAWWKDTKIGQGIHERFIINRDHFIEKLKKKSQV
ncbi:MAG: thioesterase family protein [Candidatus Ranarchaeia archaeon]|jgi:predicted thioesterase